MQKAYTFANIAGEMLIFTDLYFFGFETNSNLHNSHSWIEISVSFYITEHCIFAKIRSDIHFTWLQISPQIFAIVQIFSFDHFRYSSLLFVDQNSWHMSLAWVRTLRLRFRQGADSAPMLVNAVWAEFLDVKHLYKASCQSVVCSCVCV